MSSAPIEAPQTGSLPLLRIEDGTLWQACDEERDRLNAALRRLARDHGLACFVVRSPPGTYPVEVTFEAWRPIAEDRGWTNRLAVTARLTAMPHHRFPVLLEFEVTEGGVKRWTNGFSVTPSDLGDDGMVGEVRLRNLVAYAAGRESRLEPPFRWSLEEALKIFPRNKVDGFGMTDGQKVGIGVMVFGQIIAAVPGAALLGVLITLGGAAPLFVGWLRHLRDRRIAVSDAGRPRDMPRRLAFIDSWYALIRGIGGSAQAERERLAQELGRSGRDGVEIVVEPIGHRAQDELAERMQIVIRHRRALVFCHLYDYGGDLYIGWDAHLNFGDWQEEQLSEGQSRRDGRRVRATTVKSGYTVPTAYQFADLNGLTEWVHAQIKRRVTQLLGEHHIEQRIDFTIIRREREDLLESDEARGENDKGRRRSPMRRVA